MKMFSNAVSASNLQALFSVCATFAIASAAFADTRSQNFNVDPGWNSTGSGANSNNFGYQAASSNAGGGIGEGGGHFTRGTTGRIYADTNLGGLISLNQAFSASGKFDYTAAAHPDFGPVLGIGHFSVVGDPLLGQLSQIGIGFGSDGPDKLRWTVFVSVGFANGSSIAVDAPPGPVSYIDPNIDRTWSYAWDPAAGVNGGGQLTGTLSGPGGGTRILDLTPSQRANLAPLSVNAFGISVSYPTATDSNESADLFIDDVVYTVPEPSSLILAGLAILSMASLRKYRTATSRACT